MGLTGLTPIGQEVLRTNPTTITGNSDAIEETRRLLYLHLGRKIGKD